MKEKSKEIVVEKYASAFVNIFADSITLDDLTNIEKILIFLSENTRIIFFLNVPALSDEVKKNGVDFLCERFNISPCVHKLMLILLEHKRVFLLELVLKRIVSLYKKRVGIEEFTIRSYPKLSADSLQVIKNFLAQQTGHTIICTYIVDSSLIAGIRMQSDSHVWEYSMCQQLQAIRLYHA